MPRGCLGYQAYAKSTGGKTFDGREMPGWDELPDRIKAAWAAVEDAYSELFLPRDVELP